MALRSGFRYAVDEILEVEEVNKVKEVREKSQEQAIGMILEDLQHRYESLQPRIALVRSYL